MTVISVDPDWVSGYAKKVSTAAGELAKGADLLRAAPLGPEAFGSLGRANRVTDAYTRAAEMLRSQLARGVEALEAAAESLEQVAEKYQTSDGDGAQTIKRSGRE